MVRCKWAEYIPYAFYRTMANLDVIECSVRYYLIGLDNQLPVDKKSGRGSIITDCLF